MFEPESKSKQQHYYYVAKAIDYIRKNVQQQPTLKEIAHAVGLSEYHIQRIFTQWAGVSPKRFLQFLTKERALQALKEYGDILQASLDSGLSGPGRLHDLMVSCEAMSPGEIKNLGKDLKIGFGYTNSPFGSILLGWTPRGICYLSFVDETNYWEDELMQQWSYATFQRDDNKASTIACRIFESSEKKERIHLMIQGTNFQIKVWEALLRTKPGQLLTYSKLAQLSGSPNAQRAVGTALANNNIGWLIPCHRVIRGSGEFGNYRWGTNRKISMQGWEASHACK